MEVTTKTGFEPRRDGEELASKECRISLCFPVSAAVIFLQYISKAAAMKPVGLLFAKACSIFLDADIMAVM